MEDLLIGILPPVILASAIIFWILLKNWRKLKEILIDLLSLHKWVQRKRETSHVNGGCKTSLKEFEKEPLSKGIAGDVVLMQFEEDPDSRGSIELIGKNQAIIKIPKLNAKNVVKWTRKHVQDNIMPLFFIEDLQELRKSAELVYLKMIVEGLGFDGAYNVTLYKILKREFKKPHIESLFKALVRVNEELKPKPWVDRLNLRIILLETFKMELKWGLGGRK